MAGFGQRQGGAGTFPVCGLIKKDDALPGRAARAITSSALTHCPRSMPGSDHALAWRAGRPCRREASQWR